MNLLRISSIICESNQPGGSELFLLEDPPGKREEVEFPPGRTVNSPLLLRNFYHCWYQQPETA